MNIIDIYNSNNPQNTKLYYYKLEEGDQSKKNMQKNNKPMLILFIFVIIVVSLFFSFVHKSIQQNISKIMEKNMKIYCLMFFLKKQKKKGGLGHNIKKRKNKIK